MKKILRYLSVKQLMEDIADLNGVMSVRRFVLSTMLAGVAVYGACLLYRLLMRVSVQRQLWKWLRKQLKK